MTRGRIFRRISSPAVTIGMTMTVCIHQLSAAEWPRLRETASAIRVRQADNDAQAAIVRVVQSTRGTPGFGGAASISGLVSAAANSASRLVWVQVGETVAGKPIGVSSLARTTGRYACRWTIPFLLVSPESRRQGVANGLVRTALRVAAANGADTVMVETHSAWTDATAFWRDVCRRLASDEAWLP